MNQCDFYEECGKSGQYACEHEGREENRTLALCVEDKSIENTTLINNETQESWKAAFFRKPIKLMQGAIN